MDGRTLGWIAFAVAWIGALALMFEEGEPDVPPPFADPFVVIPEAPEEPGKGQAESDWFWDDSCKIICFDEPETKV